MSAHVQRFLGSLRLDRAADPDEPSAQADSPAGASGPRSTQVDLLCAVRHRRPAIGVIRAVAACAAQLQPAGLLS